MRRFQIREPGADFRVRKCNIGERQKVGLSPAQADESGEKAQRAARALKAASALRNALENHIEQFRRKRKGFAETFGVVLIGRNTEALPHVDVAFDDVVDLGILRMRRGLE